MDRLTNNYDLNSSLDNICLCVNRLFDRLCLQQGKHGLRDPNTRVLYDDIQDSLTYYSHSNYWNILLEKLRDSYANRLLDLNARLHSEAEKEIAQLLILRKASYDDPSLWITKDFRENLIDLASVITSHTPAELKKVCVVGGGPFPQTHMLLQQHTAVTVTTIEKDQESAVLCRKVLDKYNQRGEVICVDGKNADFSPYDVVLIATLVENKSAVFYNLLSSRFPGLIIMRRPKRLHCVWREDASFLDDETRITRVSTKHVSSPVLYNDIFRLSL